MEQGYNGWTNWETWNAYTWLSNEELSYNIGRHIANTSGKDIFEDWVTEYIESQLKDDSGIGMDFIRASIFRINFDELYSAFKDLG